MSFSSAIMQNKKSRNYSSWCCYLQRQLWQRQLQKKNYRHRYWMHPLMFHRVLFGYFTVMHEELRQNVDKFYHFTCMSIATFDDLLDHLKPRLTCMDTHLRMSVTGRKTPCHTLVCCIPLEMSPIGLMIWVVSCRDGSRERRGCLWKRERVLWDDGGCRICEKVWGHWGKRRNCERIERTVQGTHGKGGICAGIISARFGW